MDHVCERHVLNPVQQSRKTRKLKKVNVVFEALGMPLMKLPDQLPAKQYINYDLRE